VVQRLSARPTRGLLRQASEPWFARGRQAPLWTVDTSSRYVLKMRRPVQLAGVGSILCMLGAGCGLLPVSTSDVCADWVIFETPQDQLRHATLVVIGTPTGADSETRIYGYTARIHEVEVERVLKGDPEPGPLHIASMPVTCTRGVSYPEGDPLDGHRRMLIYATEQNGFWFTMTPAQGAVPFDSGTPLPFETGPVETPPGAELKVPEGRRDAGSVEGHRDELVEIDVQHPLDSARATSLP